MAKIDSDRALALVGVPFRAQGRKPAQGLDCVGLALAACALSEKVARSDYRLRGNHRQELRRSLAPHFRRIGRNARRIGDLMLIAVSDDQLHLAVYTGRGFVHADARLRQVVETPGEPVWPVIAHYRRRTRLAGK